VVAAESAVARSSPTQQPVHPPLLADPAAATSAPAPPVRPPARKHAQQRAGGLKALEAFAGLDGKGMPAARVEIVEAAMGIALATPDLSARIQFLNEIMWELCADVEQIERRRGINSKGELSLGPRLEAIEEGLGVSWPGGSTLLDRTDLVQRCVEEQEAAAAAEVARAEAEMAKAADEVAAATQENETSGASTVTAQTAAEIASARAGSAASTDALLDMAEGSVAPQTDCNDAPRCRSQTACTRVTRLDCWGKALSGRPCDSGDCSSSSPPLCGVPPAHFCAVCQQNGVRIPASRVFVLPTPPPLVNRTSNGVWSDAPEQPGSRRCGSACRRYRIANQTKRCKGPPLIIMESLGTGLPDGVTASPLPQEWTFLSAGIAEVRFVLSNGTLVPVPPRSGAPATGSGGTSASNTTHRTTHRGVPSILTVDQTLPLPQSAPPIRPTPRPWHASLGMDQPWEPADVPPLKRALTDLQPHKGCLPQAQDSMSAFRRVQPHQE